MENTPFTNRELDHYFKDIRCDITEIKAQTINTNGKVAEIQVWKEQVKGGLKVLGLFLAAFFAISSWALVKIINLDSAIKEAVVSELSTYEITVTK